MSTLGDIRYCDCNTAACHCAPIPLLPWERMPLPPAQPLFQWSETRPVACEHCYCMEIAVGITPHVQCCNCNHKRVTSGVRQ